MAEYSSDEERFSAFVNFFKDHKNTLVIGFLLLAFILTSSIGYKSYSSSQNLKAAEIYDAWSVVLANESTAHLTIKRILISYKKNTLILVMLSLQG